MSKPVLKISIPGENNMTLDIFEEEPGKLVLELYSNDMVSSSGGRVKINSEDFLISLNRLLGK